MARTERRRVITEYTVDAKRALDTLRRMERSASSSARSLNSLSTAVGRLGTGLAGMAAYLSVAELVDFATNIARAGDEVATLSLQMEGLGGSFEQLYDSAQRLGIPLQDVGDQLNLLGPAMDRAGGSFEDAIAFSEDLTNSLRLFGVQGAQANSVVLQLSQAISSGQLSGDELKSLTENAGGLTPAFEEAVQSILESEDALKDLGAQGRITSDVILEAFRNVFDDVRDGFEELPTTLEQQQARFANAATTLFAAIDEKLRVSEFFSFLAGGAAEMLEDLAAQVSGIVAYASAEVLEQNRARRIEIDEILGGVENLNNATRRTRRIYADLRSERAKLLEQDPVAALAAERDVLADLQRQLDTMTRGGATRRKGIEENIEAQMELVLSLEDIVDRSGGAETALKKQTETTQKLTTETNKLGGSAGGAARETRKLAEAADSTQKEIEETAEEMFTLATAVEDASVGAVRSFSDAFGDVFRGNIDSAKDFIKQLERILIEGVASIAAQVLENRILVSLGLAGTGLGAAGTVAAASAGGAAANVGLLSSLGSFFSGSSFTTSLAQGVYNVFRPMFTEMPGWFASAVGGIASTSTLMLAGGGLAGGVLGNILFGDQGYGGIGAGIGGAAGSVIGAALTPILGPLGPILGGLLGGTGGGFLGSLFSTGTEPYARFAVSEGQILGAGGAKLGEEALAQFNQYIADVNESLTQFGELLGTEAQEARAAYEAFSERLDPDEIRGYLEGQTYEILRTMTDAVPGAMGELVREVAGQVGQDVEALQSSLVELYGGVAAFGDALNLIQPDLVENLEDAAEIIARVGLEEAQELSSGLGSLAGLMESLKSEQELLADAYESAGSVFEELGYGIPETTTELRDLVAGLDLTSAEGIKAASAIGSVADELGLIIDAGGDSATSIQNFVDAMLSVQETLDRTRNTVEEYGLSETELYRRRKAEADLLMDALGEMTDPAQIEQTVTEINRLINEGWGLLDEGQKRAMQASFLEYLDEVEDMAEERLAIGAAPLMGDEEYSLEGTLVDFAEVMRNVDGSLENSMIGYERATDELLEAARINMAAVREFREVALSLPGSITVNVEAPEVGG